MVGKGVSGSFVVALCIGIVLALCIYGLVVELFKTNLSNDFAIAHNAIQSTIYDDALVSRFSTDAYFDSTSEKSVIPISRDVCVEKYWQRNFIPQKYQKNPAFLYTFPGSGNTWARLIIDFATGYYTGSVYNDRSLVPALPGQLFCGSMVSVIKAHPNTHSALQLMSKSFHSDNDKCHTHEKKQDPKLQKAILLIRDPYDSIWSEFQRRERGHHTKGIPAHKFNWVKWNEHVKELSESYREMWDVEYALLERKLMPSQILYVRYEDLENPERREKVVMRIMKFLDYSSEVVVNGKKLITFNPNKSHRKELSERANCALVLAENKRAHRHNEESVWMQKKDVYTGKITCGMWDRYGHYAMKHGYVPWGSINCTGTPPLLGNNVREMKNLTNVVSVISGKTKGGVRYGDRHDRLLGETTSVAAPNVQVSVVGNNVTSNEKGDDMVVDEVECVRRFSRRNYVPNEYQKNPVFLYTFPGTDDWWTRLLIDYSVGYYTGSVYTNKALLRILPGEANCGRNVPVVTAHPHTHSLSYLRGKFLTESNKCNKARVDDKVSLERAILVIRNPYESIWNEFQRRYVLSGKQRHDQLKWEATAGILSHTYKQMWIRDYYELLKNSSTENVLLVRYEDLHNLGTRQQVLHQMITFLNVTMLDLTDHGYVPISSATSSLESIERRVKCCFGLAQKLAVKPASAAALAVKNEAFTREIVCGMWAVFGSYASKYGYQPWDNMDCEGVVEIQNPDNRQW